jgi:uncharacterized membrane protein YphA (DoxX/SURF4 family)
MTENAATRPNLDGRPDTWAQILAHGPMLIARCVLGPMFIYYGVHKIGDPVDFLKQLKQYELLPLDPPIFMNLTVVALPWIEILCGLFLIFGFWLRGSALTVLTMLVVFTTAIAIRTIGIYQQGGQGFCDIAFDCGCGSGVIVICKKLAINTSLIIMSAIPLVSKSRLFAVDRLGIPAPVPVPVSAK